MLFFIVKGSPNKIGSFADKPETLNLFVIILLMMN